MSDIIPNVVVSMPSQLFTLRRKFAVVSNGKVYIGKIDTDPTNQRIKFKFSLKMKMVHMFPLLNLLLNHAGFPVYNGQISKFVTVEGYSIVVYDSYGAQQFYFPNILKYDPDQFDKRFREEFKNGDGSMVGISPNGTLKDLISWTIPEQFGAVGDGVNNDTSAIQAAIDSNLNVYFDNNKVYGVKKKNIGKDRFALNIKKIK